MRNGVRHAGLQRPGQRRQCKATLWGLRKDAQAGKSPQHPVEGLGVSADLASQLCTAVCAIGQHIGNAESRYNSNELRDQSAIKHLERQHQGRDGPRLGYDTWVGRA
jgi:hypothetical protein